jgi:adenylate cyclase
VSNLLRKQGLKELGRFSNWLVDFGLAVAMGGVVLAFSFSSATILLASLVPIWFSIATFAFALNFVLPTADALAGGILTFFTATAYRFVVADKDKRLLRRSFSFYLAPALIERMIAANKPPSLGGEVRFVTIYRSDLAGFTPLSERLAPAELVALMNDYLSAMTEIIDKHGGFVDKYIGDAIDGVFGAPLDDPNHALNAVRAALACQAKLREMNSDERSKFGGQTLRQRVGLHTGSGLVGNIGSRQRFNYTVMGDTANLASRLEGANKFYGTSIIASEATVKMAEPGISWRELDTIQVVGRNEPLVIFEPLGHDGQLSLEQISVQAAYAEGLKLWRTRDFAGAADAFGRCADRDLASSLFRERAMLLVHSPPGPDWRPVNKLVSK